MALIQAVINTGATVSRSYYRPGSVRPVLTRKAVAFTSAPGFAKLGLAQQINTSAITQQLAA